MLLDLKTCASLLALSLSAGFLVGCDDTTDDASDRDEDVSASKAVYLSAMVIHTDETSFQYAKLSHKPSLEFTMDDLKTAREFGAYASINVYDGHVYVGDQETPFVRKYRITDDLEWEEVSEPLNLSDYYSDPENGLNDYWQIKNGPDQVLFYGESRTSRVHFNLDDWAYVGTYEDSLLPKRDGWTIENAGNRTDMRNFKDAVVWPFILYPEKEGEAVPESYLAVYDGKTFAATDVVASKCPELQQGTIDEDGNFYFSPTYRSPVAGLYGVGPANCIAKLKADGSPDESFGPDGEQSFEALTGGKPGFNLRYLSNGKAVAPLLDIDAIEGANWDAGEIQPEIFCQIEYCEDYADMFPEEFWDDTNPDLWAHYVIDLEKKTATKMHGYDAEFPGSGTYRHYWQFEGATYFEVANETGETVLYELNVETAEVSLVGGAKRLDGGATSNDEEAFFEQGVTTLQRVR